MNNISETIDRRLAMMARAKSVLLPAVAVGLLPAGLQGQDDFLSEVLTDRIHKGDGVIDILKDVTSSELAGYFDETGGMLLLGVDLNEVAAPPEAPESIGVAVRQVQLSISTTDGDFAFTDFFTGTTAMLRDAGSETAEEFYTLFGRTGSSSITGNDEITISTLEDLLWLENISVTGDILSAELAVEFVETPNKDSTDAESFFDYSNGFEEFGVLSMADALAVDGALIGQLAAPESVSYSEGADFSAAAQPPAAPLPPLVAILGLSCLFLFRGDRTSKRQ